ncbi:hypothetical protein KX928_15850 [Roseobacter sp. YSTF-M11]|uniref:Uncharacterized protein n=2 Tax=Roseobacter insulae TaxID=2859783 RepID=A0A9X1FWD0_9RHOB|nr:hypothetical protein [Roseobacter insulae]
MSAQAASAQETQGWAVWEADRLMTSEETGLLVDGQTLTFFDGGQSKFSVGGAYSYTYPGGRSAFGRYRIAPDGTVCIAFRNGFGRCDRYVQNGARIVMLTQKGERFPLRDPQGAKKDPAQPRRAGSN